MTAIIRVLGGLAMAALTSAVSAGQHYICYEGELQQSLPTGVFGCYDDSGGSCQISPQGAGFTLVGTQLPGGPAGNFRIYQFPNAGPFGADIHFFDSAGQFIVTRSCVINVKDFYAYGVRGPASPGAQLAGFTTDASGLVTTGVWKLVASSESSWRQLSVQVPADFVAVGGGAMGVENPYGALVAESYQSDTINVVGNGDWRRWTARTSDLWVANPHRTTVYAIGMRIAGLAARDLIPMLRVVNQDSYPAITAHPANQVSFPTSWQWEYVFLSGGAVARADSSNSANELGQFLTETAPIIEWGTPAWCPSDGPQCYEPMVNGWRVESKDHLVSHPGKVHTALLALPPKITVAGTTYQVVGGYVSAASGVAAHPAVDVSGLRGEFALTGIGASVDWRRYDSSGNQVAMGNLLWKLEPRPDLGGASVGSKDHALSSPASITGYALGIKLVTPPVN